MVGVFLVAAANNRRQDLVVLKVDDSFVILHGGSFVALHVGLDRDFRLSLIIISE